MTYDWCQGDNSPWLDNYVPDKVAEEDFAAISLSYDDIVVEARQQIEREASEETLTEVWNALQSVSSYCERYQDGLTLEQELAAFDQKYLAEHGVYPALCDLPEHLIGVATR